jgi:hypothetical protein
MRRCLKKITASGLLLLIAIPLFFSAAVLVKQKIIQFQRQERLEKESLQTITVSVEKFSWVKPGKEAFIDGRLFDVESFRAESGNVSLTGFFDLKEDEVVQHIKHLAELEDEPGNPHMNLLVVKFLFAPVYNEPGHFSFQTPWQSVAVKVFSYTEIVPDGFYRAITPPPKSC